LNNNVFIIHNVHFSFLFNVGDKINSKFNILFLLSIILLLSISSVSAADLSLDNNAISSINNYEDIDDTLENNQNIANDLLNTNLVESNSISTDEGEDILSSSDDVNASDIVGSSSVDSSDVVASSANASTSTLINTHMEILSKNKNSNYSCCEEYVVRLLDENNNSLSDCDLSFKLLNKSGTADYAYGITDEDGDVYFVLFDEAGIYNISVVFGGNSKYKSSKIMETNAAVCDNVTITFSKTSYAFRGESIKVTFKTSLGYLVAGQKVNVVINNVTYTKTTNSKGIITLAIPNNNYAIINCTLVSRAYNNANKCINLKVYIKTTIKNNNLAILKGNYFKVTLKDQYGKAVANRLITFTIEGKKYNSTTNSKGIASVKISLSSEVHTVKYAFAGDSHYYKSSGSIVLDVIDSSYQFKKGLNQKNAVGSSKYLVGKGYSKITTKIKKLAKQLTSGYTKTLDKAAAIYNYVRDVVDYSGYANSKKGASGTLSSKKANCCDQASLVIALCRASGIYARYSHAQGCRFASGYAGHVWAQIKVGKVWYSADPTSVRNSLGHVNNWNYKSFYSLKQYAFVPF